VRPDRSCRIYKLFLSSTSSDLADYREAVHRALDGLPGFQLIKMADFQLIKMADFGARDFSAKDLCARLAGDSDLFVGLMAPQPPHRASAAASFASTASRNCSVVSHGWSGPIRSARSLVIWPPSTVSTQARSRAWAKSATAGVPSILAR
jgi:hypothetical protein